MGELESIESKVSEKINSNHFQVPRKETTDKVSSYEAKMRLQGGK